jgi:hypothetical protein
MVAALGIGCGGSSGKPAVTPSNSPQQFANLRFINGTINTAGAPIVIQTSLYALPPLKYGTITAYNSVLASGQTFTVTMPPLANQVACMTPYALNPEAYYTVVVAGNPTGTGNQALQCEIFAETYSTPAAGTAQILFHVAAPQLNNAGEASLVVGTFALPATPATTYSNVLGSSTFVPTLINNMTSGTVLNASFPGVVAGNGLAFFVAQSTPTPAPTPVPSASASPSPLPTISPLATIAPMSATIGAGNTGALPDPNNWFPIASSSTMSIYVIDSTYVAPGSTIGPQASLIAVID